MGRPKLTFLQKRHRDGQKTHKMMLNIAYYSNTANQNYNEVSLHNSQNGHLQKFINNKC